MNLLSQGCAVKTAEDATCDLLIVNMHNKQVQNFSYIGNAVMLDGRRYTEIKKRVRVSKDAFIKLEEVLRNRKLAM